jgi:glycerol-3-phosphate acyltransferase PlsY
VLGSYLTISRSWSWRDFAALEALTLAASALILIRHRGNIARLLAGKEHRF